MISFQAALNSIEINRAISSKGVYRKDELNIKRALIDEAIKFPGATPQSNMIFTEVWSNKLYSVKFGKYGKEYYRQNNPNKNDMSPTIFKNGTKCVYDASFRAIFRLCENLKNRNDSNSLIILGSLFIRNAFFVDHTKINNSYRYNIPKDALDYLKDSIKDYNGIPIDVFLMYVDAIAWQEDVKYNTLGKTLTSDIGRKNNMLTYARFIACLLGRSSFAELLNRFSMGVSPLPKKEIPTIFPELKTQY